MKHLSEEMLAKARAAQSTQELQTMALEIDETLSDEEAKSYFELLHQGSESGELSDNELENVSGGTCYRGKYPVVLPNSRCGKWTCPQCNRVVYWTNIHEWCSALEEGAVVAAKCSTCKYRFSSAGVWMCAHPDKIKK